MISAFTPLSSFRLGASAGGTASASASAAQAAPALYAPPASAFTPASAYDAAGLPTGSRFAADRNVALAKARALLRADKPAESRAAVAALLERNPRDSTAAYVTGLTYLAEGEYAQAERLLERAAAFAPESEQLGNELRFAQLLQQDDDTVVEAMRRDLAQPGRAEQGLKLATYLVQRSPANVDARVALAEHYERLGKINLAGAELSDALQHAEGEGRRALISRLEQFAGDHSDNAAAHDLLAQAYAKAGRFEDAEREFQTVRLLSNDAIDVSKDLADIYSELGRAREAAGNLTEARRAYSRAAEFSRDDVRRRDLSELDLKLAERSLNAGSRRFALEAFDRARLNLPTADADDLTGRLLAGYEKLAAQFVAAGDLGRAVSARRGAFLLNVENDTRKRALADAHDAYGLALLDEGDVSGAIRNFEAALSYYEGDSNYQSHLDLAQGG